MTKIGYQAVRYLQYQTNFMWYLIHDVKKPDYNLIIAQNSVSNYFYWKIIVLAKW